MKSDILIGVVGPCKSGKSTLVAGLEKHGYLARQITQEHSHAPNMWKKITNPDILIYLDVSYPLTLERSDMKWSLEDYQNQLPRLEHARQHADFYLDTDKLSPEQVLNKVVEFIENTQ